jgi:CubicO group peptidase (beta-lactamase class C family)
MRKTVLACLLALCLLAGCASVEQAAMSSLHSASALPLASPSPEASAMPLSSPAPITPSETPPSPSPETSAIAVLVPSSEITAASPTGSAVTETAPPSPSDEALSERLNQVFADFPGFSGSVLIERAGHVLLCKGCGMADAAMGIANTPDTKFLVGSVTKQFTSMAIMQLYAKGLLDIRDKVSTYIPDFDRGNDITLTNLLTQTSGIPDFLNDDPELLTTIPTEALSEELIIGLMKTEPLKFEPGSKYAYSNTNYLILGYIVEKVSGLSYGDYLARNIFEPLGMDNTGVVDVAHLPDLMATGHRYDNTPVLFTDDNGAVIAENASATAGSFGAGCLYSTVGDLYLWDRALSTEMLLPKKYMDMILAPSVHIENPAVDWSYGFGWVIENDPDVGTVYRHTGVLGGFRAYNGIFAEHDITVIVLFNTMDFPDRDKLIPAVKKALSSP